MLHLQWNMVAPVRTAASGRAVKGRNESRMVVRVLPLRVRLGNEVIRFVEDLVGLVSSPTSGDSSAEGRAGHDSSQAPAVIESTVPDPDMDGGSMFFQLFDVSEVTVWPPLSLAHTAPCVVIVV